MNNFRATLPTFAKKYVWEMKYGVLGYPKWIAPEDTVHYLSGSLSSNASVLDLGCGEAPCFVRSGRRDGRATIAA